MRALPNPRQPVALCLRPCDHESAFSLVEMLATIAIVAILSVLLIPVVQQVQSRARQMTCTSNLQQLGVVFMSYATDNSGILPASTLNDRSLTAGSSWSLILMNYMGMKFPDYNQVNPRNPFLCPSAMETFPNGQARRTYAMNFQNLPTDPAIAASRGWEQKSRLAQHTQPSTTILLIDAKGVTSAGSCVTDFNLSSYATAADWRHRGALNALFLDGHIESFQKSDIPRLEEDINHFAR